MARRRILPSETLAAYGATPIYPSQSISNDSCNNVPAAVPTTAVKGIKQQQPSQFPFIAKSTHNDKETPQPIGILINGWKITTQSSSIGDERQMDELTMLLEETANNNNCNTNDGVSSRSTAHQDECKKRRLCPPEITFLNALISFQYEKIDSTDGTDEVDMSSTCSEIRFSAQDSLMEWAEAHSQLDRNTANSTTQKTSTSTYRGVSIICTADAKIWSNKQTTTTSTDVVSANNNISSSNSQFYYDWTFSSPYAGTIILPPCKQRATKEKDINNRKQWQPLDQSHIPFHLLQDTTQPILLFDDIHLYEDDLHDNGDVSLNIKVRVMPKCWYILQRLYVRVDYVCVKCREVRYFCLFDNNVKGCGRDVQVNTIYRDVVWREASWDELGRLSLPTDPGAWREDANASATTSHTQVQTLASMLPRLPTVSLPDDLPRYSYFDAASNIV